MAAELRQTARAKNTIRLKLNVDRLSNDLNRRIATYVGMLRAGAALLAADPRVLLVEDDSDARDLARMILESISS